MIEREIEKLTKLVEDTTKELRKAALSNSASITINAGGIGVWIATICCSVMLGMAVVLALSMKDQQRQIDDLGHYLQAIYAQAPSLRPEETDEE